MTRGSSTPLGLFAATWGIVGVLLLLGSAVLRLTPLAAHGLTMPLTATHLGFLLPWTVFMAWSEGYRGFQKGFAPRVVVRAMSLREGVTPVQALLAPAIAIGWIHATRRRLIVSRLVTLGIVGIVVAVRLLDQPWRGLVDTGVVVGLAWGVIALLWMTARALGGSLPDVPSELPEPRELR